MTGVPWFEDFHVGQTFNDVPSVTVTTGHTAVLQAMFGDRSRLYLDAELAKRVTGSEAMVVNPSLIGNLAIGQTTIPSQRVMGNLFYRGLVYRCPVFVGDTLTTRTRVVGLRQNRPKPGRPASGMVALEMQVSNQRDETVMHFWRCPMIPCRDPDAATGHADDFSVMPEAIADDNLDAAVPVWNYDAFRDLTGHAPLPAAGEVVAPEAADTVTLAPELVRMTLNLAMTHTDARRSVYGKRLVYGGHTISMAAAQLSRAFPGLIGVLAWYRCDHVAPVFEEDILASRVTVIDTRAVRGATLARLQIEVLADRGPAAPDEGSDIKVLDWEVAALF